MKYLIFLFIACALVAQEPIDVSTLSKQDIIRIMAQRKEIAEDLEQQLQHEKNAHEDALQDIIGKQSEVDAVTKSRNDEAAAKDKALNERDAANKQLSAATSEVHHLKIQRSGIAYLLVMMVCIMFGLAKEGWAGILAAFILIPAAVSAALLALP